MLAETVLPDHDEFTRRLLSVDGDPHKMERLYPALTRRAGTQVTGTGLVLALHLAAEEYTREMPPVVAFTLLLQLDSYVRALVDDKTVQRDALAALDKIRP